MDRVDLPTPSLDGSFHPRQSALEKLTRASALTLSRRQFLGRSIVTGIAALGLSVWGFTPSALAAACDMCYGPCVAGGCDYHSCTTSQCCSPNGAWCGGGNCCCCCSPNCPCPSFQANYQICDDGSWGSSCNLCFG